MLRFPTWHVAVEASQVVAGLVQYPADVLDFLTYAPAGGPAAERILREVCGIDFFNPPDEARRTSAIPHCFNKPVWEGYARVKWQEIAWTFGVSQVLTRADWSLDLPLATQNRFWKLYRTGE